MLADSFLRDVALPLLRGGEVAIRRPIGWQAAQRMVVAASELAATSCSSDLLRACALRLQTMGVLPPKLPSLADDPEAISWLVALHDLLFLARPDALRLTPAVRRDILREIQACAQQARLIAHGDDADARAEDAKILHRHALCEPLFRLVRCDIRRKTWFDQAVQRGANRKQIALVSDRDAQVLNVLCWTELPLVVEGQGAAALQALLAGSPLTALWFPRPREAIQHEALAIELHAYAPLLRRPLLARSVCHRYLNLGMPVVAAALSGPLVTLLQRAVDDPSQRPAAITWLCLLSHMHWLAYLSVPSAAAPTLEVPQEAAPWFALFAALVQVAPQWAQPPDVVGEPAEARALAERVAAHVQRCRTAVPAALLTSLHRLLTQAVATSAQ